MLNLDTIKKYCLSKAGSSEEYPFDFVTMVFKVGKKMFALIPTTKTPLQINLKCDPGDALFLRDKYHAVKEGYHMNKKHWNTIHINGSIPDEKIYKMIDISYELVFKSLSKKEKESINETR